MITWLVITNLCLGTAFDGDGTSQPALPGIVSGVASWLDATSECSSTENGRSCRWRMNSTDSAPANYPFLANSLYYGSPGVAIFLSQFADATSGDVQIHYKNLATAALENVWENVDSSIAAYGLNAGFYYGLTGIAWSLRMVGSKMSNSSLFSNAAIKIENHILNEVLPFASTNGAKLWNNTDIAHGASGAGLALLWAASDENGSSHGQALLTAAVAAGKWLLQQAEVMPLGNGWRWWRGPDTDGQHMHQYFPTFCCGTAGVGYFLAELSLVKSLDQELQRAFADAAQQAGQHVLALSFRPERDIMLLPHGDQEPDKSVYFLGWCGGAPGWARLFVKLWQITNEQAWLDFLVKAVKGIEMLVLPNLNMMIPVGEEGIWQNLGQCCGAAAAGTFLLEFSQSDLPVPEEAKASARASAAQIAEAISSHAVRLESGIVLPSAEEHSKPRELRWQAGWMQGASGIASFLLHMHAVETGAHAGLRQPWPDEPWHAQRSSHLQSTYV